MAPSLDAAVTLRPVTRDNLDAVMDLAVAPDQSDFVAPNSVSISEYHYYSADAWMRAIYADDVPVGFLLLSTRKQRYYLWRYMIDRKHQGMGFGRRGMELLFDHVRTLPNASELFLSYVPAPGGPRDFYAALGFEDTGVEHDGELEMRLEL